MSKKKNKQYVSELTEFLNSLTQNPAIYKQQQLLYKKAWHKTYQDVLESRELIEHDESVDRYKYF